MVRLGKTLATGQIAALRPARRSAVGLGSRGRPGDLGLGIGLTTAGSATGAGRPGSQAAKEPKAAPGRQRQDHGSGGSGLQAHYRSLFGRVRLFKSPPTHAHLAASYYFLIE